MTPLDTHGHLTGAALTALIRQEPLDPLERLEIAEHLAYCDCCLQRYTLLLEQNPLLTPAVSCREPLLRRIHQRTLRLLTNRYATAAAAVALALTLLWGGGRLPLISRQENVPLTEAVQPLPERWDSALSSLSDQLRGLLDSIALPSRFERGRTP